MRRSYPPPLQFLAVASTDTAMSSRPPYRGGRNQWRRGLCSHSSGERGELVTGDSHYSSVRNANQELRQGERGGFSNQGEFPPPPFNPAQRYNQSQPFNPKPHYNQSQPLTSRTHVNQNRPLNPQPPFQPYQSMRPSGERGEFVTGDSHYGSVRNANLELCQGERGGFSNQSEFQPPPFNPTQRFSQSQPFIPNPHYNQNQPFKSRTHVNQNRPFNPRPPFQPNQPTRQPYPYRPQHQKPLDYREWECAKPGPPSHSERFIVLSYNLLAEYLAINHRSRLYYHIPRHMLDWEWRLRSILFELGLWSADIMCFQEVDRFRDLEEQLRPRGYCGIWKMRTGTSLDGCAIFWRASRFKLLHEESLEFNKLGLRDNVAQICVLESMRQNNIETLQTSSTGSNKVVVCNIHVLYNPRRGEIKLGQVRILLDKAHSISKIWNNAPVVICGDFNCTPKSPLYEYISEQKIDLSELARDKVSGQASCEIHMPKPMSIKLGNPSSDNSAHPPTRIDGAKQSDTISDTRLNFTDGSGENAPFTNNLSEPQCNNIVLDVSEKLRIEGQSVSESNAVSEQLRNENQQGAEDGNKNETVTTPSIASNHESTHSHMMETTNKENINTTSYSDNGISSELSQSNLSQASGSMNCDKETLPFVDDSHSTRSGVNLELVNVLDADVSSSMPFGRHSPPDPVQIFPGISADPLSELTSNDEKDCTLQHSQVCVSDESTSIDIVLDEKMTNLSLNELDKGIGAEKNLGEDYNTFLSELHDSGDAFPPDFGQSVRNDLLERDYTKEYAPPGEVLDDLPPDMDSEPVDVNKSTYDPSSWTPMEIESATGNADCTLLEHPLKLRSTYTEVEDLSQTRDSNGEPQVTSYNRCFFGTVDYIWRSEGIQTVRALAPIKKDAMQWTPGFPTKKWGSDHIALASELAFVKDVDS